MNQSAHAQEHELFYELKVGQSLARIHKRGNRLSSLCFENREWIYCPAERTGPRLSGNPFLFPWANRLQEDGFWFQGRYYPVQAELRDGNGLPLHGLALSCADLYAFRAESSHAFASLTTVLQVAPGSDLYLSWPFAQTITVTHRLEEGRLTITTTIQNDGKSALPVSFGYHPYFACSRPRRDLFLTVPDCQVLELDERLLPTGSRQSMQRKWPVGPGGRLALEKITLDDVLIDLPPAPEFTLHCGAEALHVGFATGFPVAVLYAPPGDPLPFVCIEPMTAPTNALFLARSMPQILPVLEAGQKYRAEFWMAA